VEGRIGGIYFPVLFPRIELNESLESDPFGDDVHEVFDAVGVGFAVLADHAASDDSGEVVCVVEDCFEGFAADVFKVDVFPQVSLWVNKRVVDGRTKGQRGRFAGGGGTKRRESFGR
jgi:hypothetical protein